ncbi:MAG: hypothetical protein H6Q36_1675, partial [Chloroflexi bacterium]|nr:hypothetical protein [Chloroflexota bacterium]
IAKSEPTLEDVFVELVGRGLSEEAPEEVTSRPADGAAAP